MKLSHLQIHRESQTSPNETTIPFHAKDNHTRILKNLKKTPIPYLLGSLRTKSNVCGNFPLRLGSRWLSESRTLFITENTFMRRTYCDILFIRIFETRQFRIHTKWAPKATDKRPRGHRASGTRNKHRV